MQTDMTVGKPMKMLLNFTIPVFLGNVFQQLYSMADAVIVGKFVGTKGLAAVGATGTITFLIIGFLMGVTTGVTVLTSQKFGAGRMDEMRKTVGNAAILSAVIAVVMTAVSMLGMHRLLVFMHTPEDIFDGAYGYIMIICAGIFTQVLYNLVSSILRALGNSKTPLYFLILAAGLNIVLDLVFIIFFHWGAPGAAWATVISQGVSGVLCLIYMWKAVPELKMKKEDWYFNRDIAVKQISVGIPMGLQFSITAIGTIIVQGAVNIYGAVYMAGFSAAGKLQNIIVTVFTAFGATVATYVGQNRGAGKMDRVHKGVRYTQIMVFVWSAVTMVLVYFFGEEMTLLFVSKTETEVLHAAEVYFRTVFWAYPFLGSIFIYRNALQGMGYGLVPMLGGVFELAARALIVLLVAGKTSFFGVCLADPAAWISALIPLIPYYIYVMKKYEKQKQLEG